jgi:hypothetical protein
MTVACVFDLFRNFSAIARITTFSRPHWFDHRHGFGVGGFLIVLLVIVLLFFGIRALAGEGKSS